MSNVPPGIRKSLPWLDTNFLVRPPEKDWWVLRSKTSDELVGIARSVEDRNEDVADMTARAGSYSIANFELLKDEFDPAEARKAETLLNGSRRLREPLNEHPDRDLDVDEADDDVGDLLDENTRSGAIDASCLFAQQMLPALAKAVKHPDMTEDLAEILSTPTVKLEYEVETGVNVR